MHLSSIFPRHGSLLKSVWTKMVLLLTKLHPCKCNKFFLMSQYYIYYILTVGGFLSTIRKG